MARSGRYRPSNIKKYRGDYRNIIYRSSWEKVFMSYCDKNDNIIEWGSEEVIIPYRSPLDNRLHRYFPDFYVKVRDKSGMPKKYISEVMEYAKNQAKLGAARNWCADRMMEFKILTEDNLGVQTSANRR